MNVRKVALTVGKKVICLVTALSLEKKEKEVLLKAVPVSNAEKKGICLGSVPREALVVEAAVVEIVLALNAEKKATYHENVQQLVLAAVVEIALVSNAEKRVTYHENVRQVEAVVAAEAVHASTAEKMDTFLENVQILRKKGQDHLEVEEAVLASSAEKKVIYPENALMRGLGQEEMSLLASRR